MDEDITLNVSIEPDVQVAVTTDPDIQVTLNDVGGPKGDTGAAGADGADGTDGIDGTDGVDGKTLLNGAVDPTTEGVDGDFYINTASNEIFGPKTSGAWGTGTSIVGPTGDTGATGLTGSAATITVGTVTTVDPTDPATVTNVGTSGAAIFDFEIPQGETGSVTAHDHDADYADIVHTHDDRYYTETEANGLLAAKENIAKVTPIAVSTSTAAGTAAKVATTTGGTYTPATGDIILVTFTAANTATNPTINIDGSGAKSILLGNVNPTAVAMAGTKVMMWYDGTAFQLFGSQRVSDTDTNTTYSEISEAEITAGTASTTRSITGRRAGFLKNADNHVSGTTNKVFTAAEQTKLSGIEALADVTDATNVAAAGAYMSGGTDVSVADGGTGASTLTSGNFLQGNGTSAVTATKAVPSGAVVGTTDTQTLTNKTLTTPTIAQINNSTAPGVKLQIRTQTDNNDSVSSNTTAGVFMQTGWGQVAGSGAATLSESVTFPTSFTTVYSVVVSLLSVKSSATPATSIVDMTVPYNTTGFTISASSVGGSGFTVNLQRDTGTFGSTAHYGYSWIAWGV